MRLAASTRLTAIFGDPVDHSMSPAMHNAAYESLGIDRAYVAFRVARAELGIALRAIGPLGILGVNLTVPHKERAAHILKNLSNEAKLLGAVNCVVNRRGALYGDNTDARGLEKDLRALRCDLAGRLAVVIGAGGGAASTILACIRLGAAQIVIANRTRARAALLARRFGKSGKKAVPIEARGLDSLADRNLIARAAVVINATSMGLTTRRFTPLNFAASSDNCLFYDLVYGREPTAFMKPAAEIGRRTADGAGMLANQGELAFELFNRVAPPAGVMRAALMRNLARA
ncbi:MAG TPA: shikimate dehydrogenase [Candidatus Binataceae bacterium]